MRVLILVCSSHEPPYDGFINAQKETWDSITHPQIDTVFYHGSNNNIWESNIYKSDCQHGYFHQHWKHKQAIDACWDKEWDIVFRTHSSSYVDKAKLYELCLTLPTDKLYGGWLLEDELPLIEWNCKRTKQDFISGAGVFYSRDIADILRKNIPIGLNIEEDVLSGRILQSLGYSVTFVNKERVDLMSIADYRPSYHYRIKSHDRLQDIKTMYLLHQKITGNMKVALVIPIYNRPGYLQQCLDSLLHLEVMPDAIFLMDDCSTDAAVQPILQAFSRNTGISEIYRSDKNNGVQKTLLNGYEKAFARSLSIN